MNRHPDRSVHIRGRAARSALGSILALAVMLGAVSVASAHAFLDHASPVVGSTVHASPAQVRIWFSERIEPAFSSIQVVDGGGQRLDKGDTAIDTSDNTLLIVSVPPLPPGTYKVVWTVVSADTHQTEGDFSFVVAP
jgi:methionine-rich copper-binding protein CopC